MTELILFLLIAFSTVILSDLAPTGDNTCTYREEKIKQIKVSYHQQVKIPVSEFCLTSITFKCVEYKTQVEVKWKTENITREILKTKCCDGYKENENGECIAQCSEGCINGYCKQPEMCSCNPGFTGLRCEISGCPVGGWGEDCANPCSCQNGGFCHPVHGGCTCPPGFHGSRCQDRCVEGTYGLGCSKKCDCKSGSTCNHVTGDCIPCTAGMFGDDCKKKCTCLPANTDFCNPADGKCFCKENRFGLQCEQYCPFGYINNTCFTTPIHNDSCQCPNHLYTCDLEKGCVCPEGLNCGIQHATELVELSPLAKMDVDSGGSSSSSATVAVIIVTLVAILVIILLAVYYRRRMKVLKTDLENRSVRWFNHNHPNHINSTHQSSHQYVIEDEHPLSESLVQNNQHNNIIRNNNLQSIPVLSNELDFSSQNYEGETSAIANLNRYNGENPVYTQYHDRLQQSGGSGRCTATSDPGPSNSNTASQMKQKMMSKGEKCEGLRVDLGGDCNYYGNTFTADSTSYTEEDELPPPSYAELFNVKLPPENLKEREIEDQANIRLSFKDESSDEDSPTASNHSLVLPQHNMKTSTTNDTEYELDAEFDQTASVDDK